MVGKVNGSPASAFFIVILGASMNAFVASGRGGNAATIMAGGAAFGIACVAINEGTKSDAGTMFAALFLLSSFLTNGVKIVNAANAIVKSI